MQLTKDLIHKATKATVGSLSDTALTDEELKFVADVKSRMIDSMIYKAQQLEDVHNHLYEHSDEFIASQIIQAAIFSADDNVIENQYITDQAEILNDVNDALLDSYGEAILTNEYLRHDTLYNDVTRSLEKFAQTEHHYFSLDKTLKKAHGMYRSDAVLRGKDGLSLIDPNKQKEFDELKGNEKAFILSHLYDEKSASYKHDSEKMRYHTRFINELRKQYTLPDIKQEVIALPSKSEVLTAYNITEADFNNIPSIPSDRIDALTKNLLGYRAKVEITNPIPVKPNLLDKTADHADELAMSFSKLTDAERQAVLQNDLEKPPLKERVDRSMETTEGTKAYTKQSTIKQFLMRHKVSVAVASAVGIVGLHTATAGLSSVAIGMYAGGMMNKYNVVTQVKEAMHRKAHAVGEGFIAMKESVHDAVAPVRNVFRSGYQQLRNFASKFKEPFASGSFSDRLQEYDRQGVITDAAMQLQEANVPVDHKQSIFEKNMQEVPRISENALYDELQAMKQRVEDLDMYRRQHEQLLSIVDKLSSVILQSPMNQSLDSKVAQEAKALAQDVQASIGKPFETFNHRSVQSPSNVIDMDFGKQNETTVHAIEVVRNNATLKNDTPKVEPAIAVEVADESTPAPEQAKVAPTDDASAIIPTDEHLVEETNGSLSEQNEQSMPTSLKELIENGESLDDDRFTQALYNLYPETERDMVDLMIKDNETARLAANKLRRMEIENAMIAEPVVEAQPKQKAVEFDF